MRRKDLIDELYCQDCGFLSGPKDFTFDEENNALCPQCEPPDNNNVVLASSVNWCPNCWTKSSQDDEQFTLCVDCDAERLAREP